MLQKKYNEEVEDISIQRNEAENENELKLLEIQLLNKGKKQQEIEEELRDFRIKTLEQEIRKRQELGETESDDIINKSLELARLKNKIAIDAEKERADKIKDIQDATAQAVFDSFQKRLDKQVSDLTN